MSTVHASAPRPIRPARPDLDAGVEVPGSKSITNRALLLAALADGESVLRGILAADDTLAFAGGLRDLGFSVAEAHGAWHVAGGAGSIPARDADVYCAEAGTAARFLLAAAAGGGGAYRFDAAPQLRRRPLAPLLGALRAQGALIEPAGAEALPLTLHARGLAGGKLCLPGDTSSQFVSALLMAAPLARTSLELTVEGLVSRPYVDMTVAMMADFGVAVSGEGHQRFVVPPAMYRGRDYIVEPDASTASYFFAAAALCGRVLVRGLHRDRCLQGDIRFLDVLEAMGCAVVDEPAGVRVTGPGSLSGITVDMSDISDTFMTLAAIAPLATSPVTITGIGNVRLKESDRIKAVEDNLRRLGVRAESGTDFVRIHPGAPSGGRVDPHGDHRIAMAFSVLGLRVPGIVVEDPDCVTKTCPTFFDLWKSLEQGSS